eukprot:GHRR01032921.1.p1 GENE.GHRR01032921.1~~GHRR01032921.1.p1  ORF type:complete len:307 (+),score=47.18 GHRR01032921.1:1-921(+)
MLGSDLYCCEADAATASPGCCKIDIYFVVTLSRNLVVAVSYAVDTLNLYRYRVRQQSTCAGMGPPQPYNAAKSPYLELETPFTAWEALKMAILLPTVPFRLFIVVISTVAVSLINSVAIYGCDIDQPLHPWRRRIVEVASQTYSGMVLRLMGFWFPRVINYHYYLEGKRIGAIGVFNHVSYLDAWVVVWAFCCAGVTFEFAKRLPILGYGVRALQNLYVPEEADKAKQQGSLTRLIRERAANRAMPMLSVAPEGTLSHGRCMLKFKTGAFVPAVPVVPILLRYKLKPHNPAWTIIITPWHLVSYVD